MAVKVGGDEVLDAVLDGRVHNPSTAMAILALHAHRAQGYRHAALDPLGEARPLGPQRLSPAHFGLTAGDAVHPEGGHWRGARQVQALPLGADGIPRVPDLAP